MKHHLSKAGTALKHTFIPTDVTVSTSAGTIAVEIPAGITITGPADWNGTFELPSATTTSILPAERNGLPLTGVVAIELGSDNTNLHLS